MEDDGNLKSEFYGVWLEPELHKKTQEIMKEKGYNNKSEYIRAAIRLLNEKF